ncbi:WXG100 family type VII secretion target [Mycobacterium sp. NPDC003449]
MPSTTHQHSPGVAAGTLHPAPAPAPAAPSPESSGGLDATHTNLDGYLNEPVRDILSRLGLAQNGAPTQSADPASPANPAQSQHSGADAPGGESGGFDPSQMIQPVTDALSSLGSGQLGEPDPTQSFDGINQALNSAGSQVQQALSGLGNDWQGDASTAAQATTQSALSDGSKVADQAAALRSSLATATAAVQTAQTRLIEIIDEYWAKIAAIGPSIIFPWGIAAAIAAATEAVTAAGEVISETESSLAGQAAAVTTAGAPVEVTDAPALGAGGTQALSPLLQLANSATSPVTQAIGSASSAASGSGAPSSMPGAPSAPVPAPATGTAGSGAGAGAGGGAGAFRGGLSAAAPATRPLGAAIPAAAETTTSAHATSPRSGVAAAGAGAPMGGGAGAPMGHHGKAGIAGGHSAPDFLHTSNQGGEIVGDLGTVAPPVIGEKDPLDSPGAELRMR